MDKVSTEEQRIADDAEKYLLTIPITQSGYVVTAPQIKAYIAGAAKEAERSKPLASALELASAYLNSGMRILAGSTVHDTIEKALQGYNKK